MSELFDNMPTTVAGFTGEDIVLSMLRENGMCWRGNTKNDTCDIVCPNCEKHKWTSFREDEGLKKYQYDIKAVLDCRGCKYYQGKEGNEVVEQRHEVKTNVATYDESLEGYGGHTGNLYIEREQYWKGEYIGKGWYTKYAEAYEGGNKKAFPEWIHFYEPYDHYERIGKERKSSDPKFTVLADDAVIAAWEADPNIPQKAGLVTKWPLELCVSIRGSALHQYIKDNKGKAGKCVTFLSKKTGRYDAYLIPVSEAIPHDIVDYEKPDNTSTAEPEMIPAPKWEDVVKYRTKGITSARATAIWELAIKGGTKGEKWVIPWWLNAAVFLPPVAKEWVEPYKAPFTPFDQRSLYQYSHRNEVAYPSIKKNKWLRLPWVFVWLGEGYIMWYEADKDGNWTTRERIVGKAYVRKIHVEKPSEDK